MKKYKPFSNLTYTYFLSRYIYIVLMIFLGAEQLYGQSLNSSSENILLALKQLPYSASVLYIAAHPDDENNRLLTYLVKGRHIRTAYLALTRGEGGQNLIGREQGDALGLIRTEELMAARNVDGAEQFFSRAIDFGFSKNPEETLSFWNRDSILSDMVWVIRKFQPDIVIDRFPTTGEGGHGNHTASAILTLDALKLAADSTAFPEQLNTENSSPVKVWKVKKAYWNTFNFGGTNTTSKDQLHIQVNGYNTILGSTYGELAAKSRSNHKSQGFGTGSAKGEIYEYFSPILETQKSKDLFDGIDTSWEKLPKAEKAFKIIQEAIDKYKTENPVAILPELSNAYKEISTWENSPLKARKLRELSKLMLACSGILVECTSPKEILSFGETINLKLEIIRRTSAPLQLHKIELLTQGRSVETNQAPPFLETNKVAQQTFNLIIDSSLSTQPYSLENPHSYFRYDIKGRNLIGMPKKPDPIQIKIQFMINGIILEAQYPVQVKIDDPVKGEFFEPISILPPVSAEADSKFYIFNSFESKKIKIKVTALKDNVKGIAHLDLPKGWKSEPQSLDIKLNKSLESKELEFSLTPPKQMEPSISDYLNSKTINSKTINSKTINSKSSNSESSKKTPFDMAESIKNIYSEIRDTAKIVINLQNNLYSSTFQKIAYEHIPWITYTQPAAIPLIQLPLNTPKRTVAYIAGAGDYIPEVLMQMGYTIHLIEDQDINENNLKKYNTVIVGVRAFNVRISLKYAHEVLMNYVKNGGCLMVQYNTTADLITDQIGPYPFKIVRDRITDETAKVTLTDPSNPLLNFPNKISENDFNGWVQERGLYFTNLVASAGNNANSDKKSDKKDNYFNGNEMEYKTLLKMHDPKESDLNTAIIYTHYGKGIFIYTSLSFFRELPAGVPGAIRLFVNLINAK